MAPSRVSRTVAFSLSLLLPLVALAAQQSPQWHATLERTVTADDAGLSRIDQLLVLPSGEFAVRQGQDDQIRFIDAATAAGSMTFGRTGEGPGEFRNLRWIGMQGGTFWAEDPTLKRITYLTAGHKLARTVPEPQTYVRGNDTLHISIGFVQGVAPDGSLIVAALRGMGLPKPAWATAAQWEGMPFLRVNGSGRILGVLAWVPQNYCYSNVPIPRGIASFSIPFCAAPMNALDATGTGVVLLQVDQTAHRYHVWKMDAKGDTAFSQSLGYTPVPIPNARFDSALTRARDRLTKIGATVPSFHRPDSYPPFEYLLNGRDGTTWLGEYRSGSTRIWRVLDRAGKMIGMVSLPANVNVSVAERGQLWGVARDSDGNESIVYYKVQ
jgi:hypothetical protein